MKERFLSVFVGLFLTSLIHAQVDEQFDGASLSESWSGDTEKFVLNSGKLQLSDEGNAGNAYIVTPSTAIDDGVWESSIQIGCKTSNSNFVRIYLATDSPVLGEPLNGYYLQLGNTGKQLILYRVKGKTSKKIGEGVKNRLDVATLSISVRVTRDDDYTWHVYSMMNDETAFTEEFSAVDSTFKASSFAGLYCKYSKTNATKYYFDSFEISGEGEGDTEAPGLASFSTSDSMIVVNFDEWVDSERLAYEITPELDSEAEWNQAHTQLSIKFGEALSQGTKYELNLSDIRDYSGNMADDTALYFAHVDEVEAGDIIFTEVMFVPYAGGSEFVEIYNKSNKVIDLSKLKFSTRKAADSTIYSAKKIASQTSLIFPEEIKVLTKDAAGVKNFYECEDASFIEMSFPSLRNANGAIVLFRSADTMIVDNFYYDAKMHVESVPDKGKGVSLERISLVSEEWTSAPEIAGYATPGVWKKGTKILTRQQPADVSDVKIDASEICYPYYDQDKQFHLSYQFGRPNYQMTVKVYSMEGICVRTLLNNATMDTDGNITWDGKDDNGRILNVAPYVLRVEAFHATNGDRYNKSFVVLVSK